MKPIQLQLNTLLPQLTRKPANTEKKAGDSTGEPSVGQDIFSRLNELNAQSIQNRKGAAKARIAELKQRIENMMRFAGIGKGNPRMVAELAKELKSLVAQYGGSGGSMMAMPIASDSTSNSESSNTTEDAASAQAQADAAQIAAQASTHSANEKTPAEAESTADQQPTSPPQQLKMTQQGGDAGDKAFFAEVKKLSQKLKQLLAMENRQLKTEADQHDFKVAKKSIRDVEEATVKAEASVEAEHAQLAAQEGGAIYDASGTSSVGSVGSSASISTFA